MPQKEEKREVKKIKEYYSILVIGSGGTGTFLLKELTHFLSRNLEAQRYITNLVVADGDIVEEKNIDRQCFVKEDIGCNKAAIFADVLNGAMEQYGVGASCDVRWEAYPNYITSEEVLKSLLSKTDANFVRCQEQYSEREKELTLYIPIIVGCVDNNAARLMMEKVFNELDYCFLYDAGNDFATGEVNFAHRLRGKTVSFEKSVSFPGMLSGDTRHVTEMSCTELNASAPQHFITNMTAGYHLLRGLVNLFTDMKNKSLAERIKNQLGYVFFDAFQGVTEFVLRTELPDFM